MQNRLLLTFVILVSTPFAFAETHYLLVDPGTSSMSNYYRFYNEVRRGYEVAKSMNANVSVAAKGGSWVLHETPNENMPTLSDYSLTKEGKANPPRDENPSYPPIASPFRKASDISSQIEKMNLKKGDQVLIYISPHGNSSKSHKDPANASLMAWSDDTAEDNNVTYRDLRDALAKVDKGVKLKIVNTACYGGGVHVLSRDLANVCSASQVSFQSRSSAGTAQESEFSRAYWNNVHEKKGRLTFAEAANHAFQRDIANPDMGSLSSSDYVDFVLNKGPYEKKFDDKNSDSVTRDGQKIWRRKPWAGFKTSLPSDAKTLGESCTRAESVRSDMERIERLAKNFADISEAAGLRAAEKSIGKQPESGRTAYQDALDDLRKNGRRYQEIAEKYEREMQELKSQWNDLESRKPGKVSGIVGVRKWQEEGTARADFQKKFEQLKAAAERDLKRYSYDHQMLEKLERLDEFNRKAAPDQKRKFMQLLQCEAESL